MITFTLSLTALGLSILTFLIVLASVTSLAGVSAKAQRGVDHLTNMVGGVMQEIRNPKPPPRYEDNPVEPPIVKIDSSRLADLEEQVVKLAAAQMALRERVDDISKNLEASQK